jgi:hypothetical protein
LKYWPALLAFGFFLAACAPEKAVTLESQLRDRLEARYGADYELVALEESTDSGAKTVCGVVRHPSEGGAAPWSREHVVLTADGRLTIGYMTAPFIDVWTKYCGRRFINPVTPIP